MKTELLFTLFALLPTLSFSQEMYEPFLEEGKVWTYHYYNDFTGHEFYETLAISGDTIVNNKSYKRIVDVATGIFECAMREDGKKVFCVYPHYADEVLLYDFGLNVGDSFQLYDDDSGTDTDAWATVVSVDTVVVGNRAFRILDVRPKDMMGWSNWWIEGIGSMYYLTSNYLSVGNNYAFSTCTVDGETIFTHKDYRTSGIPGISYTNKNKYSSFHNLQGRQVQQPTRGVYIRDGRKVVVK